ncbi:hypothetical protein AB0E96_10405 [Kitasatospora sp. NPDC036755]|uniref:hypothetical protein n=1 Tax=Kitasatospora sp. NPDC036755 TaxID=3154600 RepID=UPI0033F50040
MQTDHAHDHSRDGVRRFSVPLDDAEKRADAAAVASLYDAAIDDCHECLRELLGRVARDAAATACLAGWVCLIMSETYGGFPDELLEYNGPDSAAFNRMAKVYQQVFGHPTDVVYGTCEQLTVEERGTACVWALGLLLAPDHTRPACQRRRTAARTAPVTRTATSSSSPTTGPRASRGPPPNHLPLIDQRTRRRLDQLPLRRGERQRAHLLHLPIGRALRALQLVRASLLRSSSSEPAFSPIEPWHVQHSRSAALVGSVQ